MTQKAALRIHKLILLCVGAISAFASAFFGAALVALLLNALLPPTNPLSEGISAISSLAAFVLLGSWGG